MPRRDGSRAALWWQRARPLFYKDARLVSINDDERLMIDDFKNASPNDIRKHHRFGAERSAKKYLLKKSSSGAVS
jgi:hypothetical protein